MLWVSEGITSYYDDYLLNRAGLVDADNYLLTAVSNVGTIENMPGNKVQPGGRIELGCLDQILQAQRKF
jgi:predicted metalloprotease with PDZ domain